MKEYALFLGCTIPVRGINYEISARRVADEFGINFIDMDEFSCCGFMLKSLSHKTAVMMAARNLSIAEEKNLNICTLCNACTSFHLEVNKELKENKNLRDEINSGIDSIGRKYNGNVEVKHFARVLYEDVGIEKIEEKVSKKLDLKIAPHYGCHYLKPSEVYGNEDPEFPSSLDELIRATGATPVDYEDKNKCCGGAVLGIDEEIALRMSKEKLDRIRGKVDAMVLVCPLCSVMYDINQKRIESRFNEKYDIPILYYPQLLGLALGIDRNELGLDMNRVKIGF